MTSSPGTDATTASELRRLWEKYRPVNATRLAAVEAAVAALRRGRSSEEVLAEAVRAAHKLAGSLGMFGYNAASILAREAEELLEGGSPDAARLDAIAASIRSEILPAAGSLGDSPAPEAPASTSDVDVMIVDDDEVIAGLLVYALEKQGYTTGWIDDGKTALERLCGAHPEISAKIIVLDVNLPGVDGMTLLRRLAGDGVTDRSHVIMLTVRSAESEVVKALQLGASDHVAKPFSLRVFVEKIRRALKR